MDTGKEAVDVDVPVRTACKQWTQLEEFPDFVEGVEDLLGVIDRRVEGDLSRFKDHIEERGGETGAWRGRIRPGNPGPA
ncbi:hypothetical protein ABZ871_15525 [Streptomyces populi]